MKSYILYRIITKCNIFALYLNNEEVKIEITQKNETDQNLTYSIAFTQIQTGALEMFAKNNFTVSRNELEAFSKSIGVFNNQLIESINEICYDNIDDILIEEEEDNYIINEIYYKKILAI